MSLRIIAAAAAFLCLAPAASGQRPRPAEQRPEVVTRLVQCRGLGSAQERLACYDREVAALDAAQSSGDLITMDRQEVRRTRRSLFGLALPNLGVFGDDNDDDEAASRLESTVRSATQNANGKWIITIEDGARWQQIDSRNLGFPPRAGQPIRIRRAGLGSYFVNVNGQTAIRMRRIN